MSEGAYKIPEGVDRETFRRLYDNPDEQLQQLSKYSADKNTIESEYAVFQALSNKDRLRLLEALREGERCGCELIVILDSPQSTVSTHLRKLREAGLVKSRRKGKWNYYRIADTAVMDILDLATATQHQ